MKWIKKLFCKLNICRCLLHIKEPIKFIPMPPSKEDIEFLKLRDDTLKIMRGIS